MRTPTLFLLALALFTPLASAQPAPKANSTGGVSPHETTSTFIDGDYRTGSLVTITYGRPYAKDPQSGAVRKIWGALVPWGQPWRAGSDEATLLLNQATLVFGNVTLPPGAYVLYLIPMETGPSKLVFSKATAKWGIPVDTASDIARVDLIKGTLAVPVPQFTIAIEAGSGPAGTLRFSWESTQFSVPFQIRR
jgi:hypothetical protein